MAYTTAELKSIYDRTSGYCHICHDKVYLSNYAAFGGRGAWEVDHGVPKARGGTDRFNNLYAACVSCNRSKRDGSTRSARAAYDNTRAPLSREKRREAKTINSVVGGGLGAFVGGVLFGPVGVLVGLGLGATAGNSINE